MDFRARRFVAVHEIQEMEEAVSSNRCCRVVYASQKFPLRDKQLRELQKQAWQVHEEERKRKYMDFLQKKKQGDESGRYNEIISAKTKLQKELAAAQAAATKRQHSGAKTEVKKPVTADQPEPRQKAKHNESSAIGTRGGHTPAFTGDFVTITKDQLKILLDAAEGLKNKPNDISGEERGYANSTSKKHARDDIKSADHQKEDPPGNSHIVAVTTFEPEHIEGLSPRSGPPTVTDRQSQPPPASLSERKRQQWAAEKEELAEYLKDAAAAAVRKAIKKNEFPLPGDAAATTVVSHILSESLREKKLRQWEIDQKLAQEAKGSLAEIGQHIEERKAKIFESETPQPRLPPKNELKKQSLVEKKKRQWDMEKGMSKEGSIMAEWFGKSGAGAPIRSEAGDVLTQYGARSDEVKTVQDTLAKTYGLNIVSKKQPNNVPVVAPDFANLVSTAAKESARNVVIAEPGKVVDSDVPPAAMRSAFAAGGAAPDERLYDDVKKRERQSWLEELKRQIEEKTAQKAKERQVLEAYYRDDPVAPHQETSTANKPNVSKPSEKQIVQVEYDKKRPLESENKYSSFIPASQEGIETERARIERRQKEVNDNTGRLHQALAQAEIEAQRAKLIRRIEKLRAGGHDTRGLERTYKDLLTPRGQNGVPSIAVAGLTDGYDDGLMAVHHQATRILTPTDRRGNNRQQAPPPPPPPPAAENYYNEHDGQSSTGRESCAVQTEDFVFASGKRLRDILREQSKVEIEFRDSKLGNRNGKKPQQQQQQKVPAYQPPQQQHQQKREEKKTAQPAEPKRRRGEKKPWQYQNTKGLQAVKASDREIALGSAERSERDRKRKERALQLIALAEVNMAKSRLLPGGNDQRGRLVPFEGEGRRPRSRSNQREPVYQDGIRRQRHVSPPPDLPSARYQQYQQPSGRNMPPPPQRRPAEAEFLPYRRTSGGLERSELPANYDIMIDTSSNFHDANGAEKGELMRQHLQFLKQGLLRRQQELERSMTPNTLSEVRASQQYRN